MRKYSLIFTCTVLVFGTLATWCPAYAATSKVFGNDNCQPSSGEELVVSCFGGNPGSSKFDFYKTSTGYIFKDCMMAVPDAVEVVPHKVTQDHYYFTKAIVGSSWWIGIKRQNSEWIIQGKSYGYCNVDELAL